jgi:hypothetical protein
MIMMLPRWIRQIIAKYKTWNQTEIGGMLHDYKNGRWEKIRVWNTQEESDAAMEIIAVMLKNQRDEIYIVCVKLNGFGRGYFIIFDSNYGIYRRDFWMRIYDPDEALIDVSKQCRKIATGMGYRRPDEDLGHS